MTSGPSTTAESTGEADCAIADDGFGAVSPLGSLRTSHSYFDYQHRTCENLRKHDSQPGISTTPARKACKPSIQYQDWSPGVLFAVIQHLGRWLPKCTRS